MVPCHLRVPRAQFMSEIGGCIVFIDFMKVGTLSQKMLDKAIGVMNTILRHRPQTSCGFVIQPYLSSGRLTHGARGERKCLGYKGTGL